MNFEHWLQNLALVDEALVRMLRWIYFELTFLACELGFVVKSLTVALATFFMPFGSLSGTNVGQVHPAVFFGYSWRGWLNTC